MGSISASIQLYDRMSAPLQNIMSALNMTISSMRDMQSTMGSDMDTSSLDAATQAANQAQAAIEAMNQAMNGGNGNQGSAPQQIPSEPPTPSTEPVQVPVEWVTNDLDVFSNSGMDRFQQEVNATNQMLTTLSDRQNEIAQNAVGTDIFSDSAMQDINSMGQRIQAVQQRIQQIENNPVNFGTDTANAELEQLRSQLNQALQAQEDLNQAVQNMDVSAANAAYNQLSSTVANTERYIRDNADAQGNLNEQIQAGVQQSNEMVNTVKRLAAAYLSIQTLSSVIGVSDELVSTTTRLDQMNDGLQTTDELLKMVYISAQDARGSFGDMAAVVAKFGNNAKDAFSSSQEVVAFANLIQKQMTIAGASTQEASNAMLQLSQALGSGVLRGDELNSIFEQAPNLIQSIADYLDVPIGKIREMAQEGQLSADVVKAAIFASADEINAKFDQMPMTWGQVWTSMQNSALMAFQPVLNKINELANNEQFMVFVENATGMMATLATYILSFFETMGSIATFVSENWSVISPLVYGVVAALAAYLVIATIINTINAVMAAIEGVKAAAQMMATGATLAETAAQYGLNAALAACPITWIIAAIIALIAVIFAVCQQIANMTGVANSGFGVICGGVNVVIQFFKNLGLTVANIALGIGNAIAALGSNMMTAFHNAICSVQSWFYNLLSTALTVIAGICEALNKLPFVEFDYSGITSAADDYAAKASEAAGNKQDYKSIGDAFNEGMSTFDTFQKGWASDAFNAGAAWGDGVADKVSNGIKNFGKGGGNIPGASGYDFSNMSDYAGQTAANTGRAADAAGRAADSVSATEENLKYLRDIAEQEAVNRFTTAEITVNQTNNNNVSGTTDIDGMVSSLTAGVNEALNIAAEGVHK